MAQKVHSAIQTYIQIYNIHTDISTSHAQKTHQQQAILLKMGSILNIIIFIPLPLLSHQQLKRKPFNSIHHNNTTINFSKRAQLRYVPYVPRCPLLNVCN